MPSASSPGMQARTGTRAHARPGARTRTHARERARTRGGLRVRPWGAHAPTRSLPDTSETLPRFREEQPEDARSTEKAKLPVTARGAPGSRSVLLASLTSGTQHAPTPDVSPLAEQRAGRTILHLSASPPASRLSSSRPTVALPGCALTSVSHRETYCCTNTSRRPRSQRTPHTTLSQRSAPVCTPCLHTRRSPGSRDRASPISESPVLLPRLRGCRDSLTVHGNELREGQRGGAATSKSRQHRVPE